MLSTPKPSTGNLGHRQVFADFIWGLLPFVLTLNVKGTVGMNNPLSNFQIKQWRNLNALLGYKEQKLLVLKVKTQIHTGVVYNTAVLLFVQLQQTQNVCRF